MYFLINQNILTNQNSPFPKLFHNKSPMEVKENMVILFNCMAVVIQQIFVNTYVPGTMLGVKKNTYGKIQDIPPRNYSPSKETHAHQKTICNSYNE